MTFSPRKPHLRGVPFPSSTQTKRTQDPDVVLTSYGTARRDPALTKHKFSAIVIDEAQNIKNATSQTAKGVCAFVRAVCSRV